MKMNAEKARQKLKLLSQKDLNLLYQMVQEEMDERPQFMSNATHTKFVKEEDYASLPKFYSKEEVDKLTSEAYNQGYEDGRICFYGMTSKDEENIKRLQVYRKMGWGRTK